MTNQELKLCIDEYGKDVYSFCRHLAGSLQEADDLYQDTFLKALELDHTIDFTGNPKSYLLSIALRIWKNRRRKTAWRKRIADIRPVDEEADFQAAPRTDSPEQQLIRREQQELVKQAVNRLPEKYRVIVLLYYMEEMQTAQIAGILHLPAGTVKSRLYQARKMLEKELEDVLYG